MQVQLGIAALATLMLAAAARAAEPARGPLKVHPDNPRYFTDGSGRAVYLTGLHTWPNIVDMGPTDPPPKFDFDAYLDALEKHGHNYTRLWAWESTTWDTEGNGQKVKHHAAPQPWPRSGGGKALDGKPRFVLSEFNPEYFDRLRVRSESAAKRGIYVSIMLFEGWAMQFAPAAWPTHPFHAENNVNKINGDVNGDGKGLEVHELVNPAVTAIQEAYVRKVIDTVNDLDNVMYEISNENHPESTAWQYHMIRFIHAYEKTKPKQHPVGMTFQYKGGSNRVLFDSPADWVSPNPDGGYRDDPPAADGRKVVLNDTDHLWGIGGNSAWVWKSFLRGHNVLFMDPYDRKVLDGGADDKWEPVRRSMGLTLQLARRMDLAKMTPRPELASTKYCLASPGAEYAVFLPAGGSVKVDLSAARSAMTVEWIELRTGKIHAAPRVDGGAWRNLRAPFEGEAVVHLARGE